MLHKQKFDEAERFARQFNLDVEVKALKVTTNFCKFTKHPIEFSFRRLFSL